MIKLGFTGTRQGMTPAQLKAFTDAVRGIYHKGLSEFHHGDCIGADAEAHTTIAMHADELPVYIHPPEDNRYRAHMDRHFPCHVLPPKPYLERDRDIVNACDMLIGCPRTMEMPKSLRSEGTWYTINYAVEYTTKPVRIILPDGSASTFQRLN